MTTYVVTFFSHFSAIAFHKAIKSTGIQAVLMPVPRSLSSSCGTCVKITGKEEPSLNYTKYDGIEKVFHMDGNNGIMVYEA